MLKYSYSAHTGCIKAMMHNTLLFFFFFGVCSLSKNKKNGQQKLSGKSQVDLIDSSLQHRDIKASYTHHIRLKAAHISGHVSGMNTDQYQRLCKSRRLFHNATVEWIAAEDGIGLGVEKKYSLWSLSRMCQLRPDLQWKKSLQVNCQWIVCTFQKAQTAVCTFQKAQTAVCTFQKAQTAVTHFLESTDSATRVLDPGISTPTYVKVNLVLYRCQIESCNPLTREIRSHHTSLRKFNLLPCN